MSLSAIRGRNFIVIANTILQRFDFGKISFNSLLVLGKSGPIFVDFGNHVLKSIVEGI